MKMMISSAFRIKGAGMALLAVVISREPEPETLKEDLWIDSTSQHGDGPRQVVKRGCFIFAPRTWRIYRPAARMARGIDPFICPKDFRCVVRQS
jgi:hypothetical protein